MASVHRKMTAGHTTEFSSIIDELRDGISAELVARVEDSFGEARAAMLSFEKFYFRTGSYAGLTVYLTDNGSDLATAHILGFSGGGGILNISWGANANFAAQAERILRGFGFQ